MGADGVDVAVTRSRELAADVARVWAWMTDVHELPLFHLNVFHAEARCADDALDVGSEVDVLHRFAGRVEPRRARVTVCAPYRLGWAETRVDADDWFPHAQEFELESLGAGRCRVTDTLRGTFRVRGARWWLLPWYRLLAPRILDAELRGMARALEGG